MDFDKRDSNIVKCFAIFLMLAHHLFFSMDWILSVCPNMVCNFISIDTLVLVSVYIGKICVSLFIFLTGYGISCSYRIKSQIKIMSSMDYGEDVCRRFLKLWFHFLFIYLLSFFVALFSETNNPFVVYSQNGIFYFNLFVDALGLANGFMTPTLNGTWWYMTLAYMAIWIMPLVWRLTRSFGFIVVLFFVFFLPFCGINNEILTCYLASLVLGCYCSEFQIFSHLKNLFFFKFRSWTRIIAGFTCAFLFVLCGYLRIKIGYMGIFNTILAFLLILFCWFVFHDNKKLMFLGNSFAKIGDYSSIIFLTHTFLYCYYLEWFIYSFKYPVLIFIVLLLFSLLLAIAIRKLQKILKYDQLMMNVDICVEKLFRKEVVK